MDRALLADKEVVMACGGLRFIIDLSESWRMSKVRRRAIAALQIWMRWGVEV